MVNKRSLSSILYLNMKNRRHKTTFMNTPITSSAIQPKNVTTRPCDKLKTLKINQFRRKVISTTGSIVGRNRVLPCECCILELTSTPTDMLAVEIVNGKGTEMFATG